MKKLAILFSLILPFSTLIQAEQPKIGLSLALSGDASTFGEDIKRGILLANEDLGSRYNFIIEDDKCNGRESVAVANKLSNVDHVKYVIGFNCNQSLMSAGSVYQRNKVVVVSPFATTGDQTGIGDHIFRIFPPDHYTINAIYPVIESKHRIIAIITEQNEFPELLRRTMEKRFKENPTNKTLLQEEFQTGESDLKPLLLRLKNKKAEGIFLAVNSEATFIRIVQQMHEINFAPEIYATFFPATKLSVETLGNKIENMVYVDLAFSKLFSKSNLELISRLEEKFGPPNTTKDAALFGYEALRVLNEAIASNENVVDYLHKTKFNNSILGKYSFDSDGASEGLGFELYQYKSNGKHQLYKN